MISDHVENESMVQQMFSYANAHGRGNNHMPNRTAQSNQERLSKMEAELVKSKQNVVKHVLESRKLEINCSSRINRTSTSIASRNFTWFTYRTICEIFTNAYNKNI